VTGESRYYWDYLHLDRLLGAQELESAKEGETAHEEMLFIIVHQAYELWFKQILWELDSVNAIMGRDSVDEKRMGTVVGRLERITEIQKLLIGQLEVLETMTPLDFLEFRDLLVPASGFQSVQFRLIENKLGLPPEGRLKIRGDVYTTVLSDEHVEQLRASEEVPSLLDHVERWLERTPFLDWGDVEFWAAYRDAVHLMLERDRSTIATNPTLDDETREEQLAAFDATAETFASLFEEDRYAELLERGERRMSRRAFLAALFISLYRDEPAVTMPHRLITRLIDIDEGFTAWRQRHAVMVHRMIGGKIGTGGTSGHRYLQAAADRHKVFGDLFELSTYYIKGSELPELPTHVREQMQFRFGPA
jgi:tryptophan 2,3-dioxygenase